MSKTFPGHSGANQTYTERTPERLVLEGYRHWSAGFETQSIAPWELAFEIYRSELGANDGKRALAELSHYVRTLKACSQCPLRASPFHSKHLCLEECLSIGLIAGMQHDDNTSELCLQHLSCPLRENEIATAAKTFAMTLSDLGQRLLPVPASAINDVVSRNNPNTFN